MIGYVKPINNLINFVATNVIPSDSDVEVDFTEDLINEINQPKSLSLDGMQQGNIYLYNLDGSINTEQQASYDNYLAALDSLSKVPTYTEQENNYYNEMFGLFLADSVAFPLSDETKKWKEDNSKKAYWELEINKLLQKLQPE